MRRQEKRAGEIDLSEGGQVCGKLLRISAGHACPQARGRLTCGIIGVLGAGRQRGGGARGPAVGVNPSGQRTRTGISGGAVVRVGVRVGDAAGREGGAVSLATGGVVGQLEVGRHAQADVAGVEGGYVDSMQRDGAAHVLWARVGAVRHGESSRVAELQGPSARACPSFVQPPCPARKRRRALSEAPWPEGAPPRIGTDGNNGCSATIGSQAPCFSNQILCRQRQRLVLFCSFLCSP